MGTFSAASSTPAGADEAPPDLVGQQHARGVAPGDLVLLCVQRPHAVTGWTTPCTRASVQSFLNYGGDEERITMEA